MKYLINIVQLVRPGYFIFVVVILFQGAALADQRVRIGAVGDSYASGEGAPDGAPPPEQHNALWRASPSGSRESETDALCHRSQQAWPYKSAERFGANNGKLIDFSSFACSGAEVPHLIESEFKSVGRDCFDGMGGQLCELEKRFEGKLVDALLVSIGGNDVGFGPTVAHCIFSPSLPNACQNVKIINIPSITNGASTDITAGKNELKIRYQKFADAVESVNKRGHIYIANVFMVEYPSPMRDGSGRFCNPSLTYPFPHSLFGMPPTPLTGDILDTVDGREARWAAETVIPALNSMVSEGAGKIKDASGNPYGFFVHGTADSFRNHGYCSVDHRWINLARDAISRQGDYIGMVHPNMQGHDAYRDVVVPELTRVIPPGPQKFKIQGTSAGEQVIAINPAGMRLVWSGNTNHAANYQVAVRSSQINGVFQPLVTPAKKWPDSFGVPPRHIGTDEQGWALIESDSPQGHVIFVSQSGQKATVPAPVVDVANDYLVRSCTEAMCSQWSDPIRVVAINGFEAKPQITNVKAEKTGPHSIKVSWPGGTPRANTFDEVFVSSNGTSWMGSEVPSGHNEAEFVLLNFANYSVTVRECTWSIVSSTERKYSKCSPWSEPVSAPPLVKLDTGHSSMVQMQGNGKTITQPKTPPVDFHVRFDKKLIGKAMQVGQVKKYIESNTMVPSANILKKE